MTAFALGFAPHVQRHACTDLFLRTYPVDVFLPLAIAPVAPLHRIRRRWQQLVIKKREGLFQGGRKELLECLPSLGEAQAPPPQFVQFVQSRLGPTAPIKQGVDLCHELAQCAQLRQVPGDPPPPLPFAVA